MNSIKNGDTVIIYSGKHYGRKHTVIAIVGQAVHAVQVDTGDFVNAPLCDCELIQQQEVA